MANLLTILTNAVKEIGGMAVPSTVIASTDATVIKMLALSNREGRDLVEAANWTVLQRLATITTVTLQEEYALPSDYSRLLPDTEWDRTGHRLIMGALSPQDWQMLKSGSLGSGVVGRRYRLARSGTTTSRMVRIDPIPPASSETLVYEYISNAWCSDVTGTTLRSAWAVDTDVSLLDEDLMTLGLIVRFKRSTGLDYASEADEYAQMFARKKAQDRPSGTLDLVAPMFGPLPGGSFGGSVTDEHLISWVE